MPSSFQRRFLMTLPTFFRIAYSINPKMNPANPTGQVSPSHAKDEFHEIMACHRRLGHQIELMPAVDFPDFVFTANHALCIDGKVMLGNPRPAERRGEIIYARKALEELSYQEFEEAPFYFSGQGDALHLGPELIMMGKQWRTDPKMAPILAEYFDCEVVALTTIPAGRQHQAMSYSSHFYDLDLAVAPLQFGKSIAYCPEAFAPKERAKLERALIDRGYRLYPVPLAEALKGCLNLISDGSAVMRPDVKSSALEAAIAAEALADHRLKVTELWKGGGAIRCTALDIN